MARELGVNADQEAVVSATESLVVNGAALASSRWWLVSADAEAPVAWRFRWAGRTRLTRSEAWVTGRSVRVALDAAELQVFGRSLTGEETPVSVAVYATEFQRETANVYETRAESSGIATIPPFAETVVLETAPLDNPVGVYLKLLDADDEVICAVGPNTSIYLGSAVKVETVCAVSHRLIFGLTI